jgi:hypothetical protein
MWARSKTLPHRLRKLPQPFCPHRRIGSRHRSWTTRTFGSLWLTIGRPYLNQWATSLRDHEFPLRHPLPLRRPISLRNLQNHASAAVVLRGKRTDLSPKPVKRIPPRTTPATSLSQPRTLEVPTFAGDWPLHRGGLRPPLLRTRTGAPLRQRPAPPRHRARACSDRGAPSAASHHRPLARNPCPHDSTPRARLPRRPCSRDSHARATRRAHKRPFASPIPPPERAQPSGIPQHLAAQLPLRGAWPRCTRRAPTSRPPVTLPCASPAHTPTGKPWHHPRSPRSHGRIHHPGPSFSRPPRWRSRPCGTRPGPFRGTPTRPRC